MDVLCTLKNGAVVGGADPIVIQVLLNIALYTVFQSTVEYSQDVGQYFLGFLQHLLIVELAVVILLHVGDERVKHMFEDSRSALRHSRRVVEHWTQVSDELGVTISSYSRSGKGSRSGQNSRIAA